VINDDVNVSSIDLLDNVLEDSVLPFERPKIYSQYCVKKTEESLETCDFSLQSIVQMITGNGFRNQKDSSVQLLQRIVIPMFSTILGRYFVMWVIRYLKVDLPEIEFPVD